MDRKAVLAYLGADWAGTLDLVRSTLESDIDLLNITNSAILDRSGKQLRPAITVLDAAGTKVGNSMLPDGAILTVKDGDVVTVGSTVAKLPRAAGKTRDITGGLPRVAELFEARRPKNTAVLAPIDGLVAMGNEVRGNQEVIIKMDDQEAKVLVPRGVHLAVNEGDRVRAGQKISEGSADPHDILAILGPEEVQRHLVNEIQAVYRLQGVAIADKHIECIVRQMMRKVRIKDSGDSELLPGEEISKARLRTENDRLVEQGKTPATFTPMLLGITKASLATDSFISACSFIGSFSLLRVSMMASFAESILRCTLIWWLSSSFSASFAVITELSCSNCASTSEYFSFVALNSSCKEVSLSVSIAFSILDAEITSSFV